MLDALKLAVVLAPLAACASWHVAPVTYAEIIATTESGESYVAGSGDTCEAAWEGRRLPSDWVAVVCHEFHF